MFGIMVDIILWKCWDWETYCKVFLVSFQISRSKATREMNNHHRQLFRDHFKLAEISTSSKSSNHNWVHIKALQFKLTARQSDSFVMSCYRPQTKFVKVMFLHLSVIPLTGGCLPQYMLGYTPQADPPPPGADTSPWDQTPLEQTPLPPCAVHAGRYRQ